MQLAQHELYDLNELTMSCVNSICNMAYMLDHVQDPEFKAILEKHFPYHVRDYNMKVEFLQQQEGSHKELPQIQLEGKLSNYTEMVAPLAPAVQPRTTVMDFNDREMATAYLLTLKRAGREYAWTAMEMANRELRGFVETAFLMSSAHAYEVWQYMVKRGYYALSPASPQEIQTIGNMYMTVPENQPRVQGLASQYQTPMQGNSQQMIQH